MSDVSEFLDTYHEALDGEVQNGDWPKEILELYSFDSCLKYETNKEVYLVTDKRTGGKAILRVTTNSSGDRADAEAAILSRLNHPGVPKTYGALATESKSFIIREFIHGRPLDAVMAQQTMTSKDIFTYARKLCDILEYLHHQVPPVIHRDIKPQNIILKPDGSIALTDFGIARVHKPGSDSDTHYAGTLPYAPPEQYGYAQSTAQTDIYAMGIVLVYLATGSPNRQDLHERIKDKRLLALINRCIAFDPADRFTPEAEIRRFIDKSQSRSPKLALGIAASLVAALALGGLFVYADVPARIASLVGAGTQVTPIETPADTAVVQQQEPSQGQSQSQSQGASSSPSGAGGQLFNSAITGNLPGNINNGGFLVEGDEETYVALSDGVYVLESDGSIGRLVVSAKKARAMNFYQGMLYYARDIPGLFCADPTTGETSLICGVALGDIYIDSDTLYFENGEDSLNLYTIGFDGSGMRKVSDYGSVFYRNIVDGYQYFTNTKDEETLYRANLETGAEEQLYDIRSAWISLYDSRIYFSDFSIPGALLSMDLGGGPTERLYYPTASFNNACSLGVFFVDADQKLRLVSHDGASSEVLVTAKCDNFCVSQDWIVYKNLDDGGSLWIVRTNGTDNQLLS